MCGAGSRGAPDLEPLGRGLAVGSDTLPTTQVLGCERSPAGCRSSEVLRTVPCTLPYVQQSARRPVACGLWEPENLSKSGFL